MSDSTWYYAFWLTTHDGCLTIDMDTDINATNLMALNKYTSYSLIGGPNAVSIDGHILNPK